MRLFRFSTSSLLALLSSVVVTSALTVVIPPSNLLPNPNALPSGTHATLTSIPPSTQSKTGHVSPHSLTAPLTRSATFILQDLDSTGKPESYLLDIRSAEYVFTPYRVDVAADGTVLGVWETFRGNPWENRGAERYVLDATSVDAAKLSEVVVEAKVLARRGFYEERSKCEHPWEGGVFSVKYACCFLDAHGFIDLVSPLALFKNPMILLALVALGFTFGMPKLMENSKFNIITISLRDAIMDVFIAHTCPYLYLSSGSRDACRIRKTLSGFSYLRCNSECYHRWRCTRQLRFRRVDGWRPSKTSRFRARWPPGSSDWQGRWKCTKTRISESSRSSNKDIRVNLWH